MKKITIVYDDTNLTDVVVRQRILEAGVGAFEIDGDNVCEGCVHCQFAGVRWPASPDGDTTHSYAEKCDYCGRFEDDYDAAEHVAKALGCNVGLAYRCVWDDAADGINVGDVYLEPVPPSDKAREAWDDGPSGTSLFLDRPERDGE